MRAKNELVEIMLSLRDVCHNWKLNKVRSDHPSRRPQKKKIWMMGSSEIKYVVRSALVPCKGISNKTKIN